MILILYFSKTFLMLYIYILALFFIDIVIHLIENISNSLSFSSSSSFGKKTISILGIIEIIQATDYIIPCQHLSQLVGHIGICLNIYCQNRLKKFWKFAQRSVATFNALVQYLKPQEVF